MMFGRITALLLLIPFAAVFCADNISNEVIGERYGHDIVYDEQQNQAVLFGGFQSDGKLLDGTWFWSENTWKNFNVAGPSPRKWPAMAYNSKSGQTLLFGGRTGLGQSGSSLADTWVWNGENWKEIDVSGPPARDHHRMVYDRKRDRTVLFGGWDGEKVIADTWEWDGLEWHQMMQTGPTARAPFGLAYDERNEQVVLFGGKSLTEYFDDTWVWDGVNWNEIDVEGPSARAFHAMTFDPDNDTVLLFSGRFEDTMFNDTWSWDGNTWKMLSNNGPTKRGVYALIYNRDLHQAMFYGSGIRENNTWILDDETWIWENNSWQIAR